MKKVLVMLVVAVAFCAVAEDKVWPANYWQTVTNMVTAATPTGNATASQAVGISQDTAAIASSPYSQQLETRTYLTFGSENAVVDFNSYGAGFTVIVR